MRTLGTYWLISEGIWNPLEGNYAWRDNDSFATEREARKAIRDILEDWPTAVLMLSTVTIKETWNHRAQAENVGSAPPLSPKAEAR